MMEGAPRKVVFDCPVYAQALINARGPASSCLNFAQTGKLILFVSDYVLGEIRELPDKIRPKFGMIAERAEGLILDLAKYARFVKDVPPVHIHPVDPDDSHYINLAAATGSDLIVSRDAHLLNLMDPNRTDAQTQRAKAANIGDYSCR